MRSPLAIAYLFILFAPMAMAASPALKSIKELKTLGIERQTLDYSCGASALSILLTDYFNDPFEEKELLAEMAARLSQQEIKESIEQGFSMLSLKKQAVRLGYIAHGVILPPEALNALQGPIIILLKSDNLNHFVVLKGVTEGRAFITDPARGHMRMPVYKLFEQWDGEALILGRSDFGLPNEHGLSLPDSHAVAPERDLIRSIRQRFR